MKPNKTQETDADVSSYLRTIDNSVRRQDAEQLVKIMAEATGTEPRMWGPSIIGFGTYHYIYESGREGDTPAVGFSSRKQALVLYGIFHYEDNETNVDLAGKLGTHTSGKGCVYIKSLSDVDLSILKMLVANAYKARMNT